jgi:hypothetical protein
MPTEQEKRWIAAWRSAGPELERIRNEELRSLDESEGFRLLGANPLPKAEGMNGMAIQQAWFMRMRVKQLMKDALADDT